MNKKIIFIAVLFVAVFAGGATKVGAEPVTPLAFVKTEVEAVFAVLRKYPVEGPAENLHKRRAAIKKIIDASFDSREMSRWALGRYWKELTTEQQDEFVTLFYWRLYNFYILRIETYSDEKVVYGEERLAGSKASVQTRVSSRKYPEFDIEYRLKRSDDSWRVYDVVIEGVSLIANYRSQFGNFLSKKSVEELLKTLREKSPENTLSK